MKRFFDPAHRWRWAILAWLILLSGILFRCAWSATTSNSVYPIYAHAGRCWLDGTDLYQPLPGMDLYRYSPGLAPLFVPWSLLPDRLGGMLWRLVGAGLFLLALSVWCRSSLGVQSSASHAAIWLLAWPLTLPSLNNGQINVMMSAGLLLAVAALSDQRWWVAAGLLAGCVLLKVYPVAVALLLMLARPNLSKPLLATLILALLVPLALQRPSYVIEQYAGWWDVLTLDNRAEAGPARAPRNLLFWLRAWGGDLPLFWWTSLRIVSACLLAVLVRLHRSLSLALSLGCVWIVLFGPATESCTYIVLVPAFVVAWQCDDPLSRWLVRSGFACCAVTVLDGLWPRDYRLGPWGTQPFGALLLGLALVVESIRHVLVQSWVPARVAAYLSLNRGHTLFRTPTPKQ